MLSVVMLSVIMLSVVMLSVVVLRVEVAEQMINDSKLRVRILPRLTMV